MRAGAFTLLDHASSFPRDALIESSLIISFFSSLLLCIIRRCLFSPFRGALASLRLDSSRLVQIRARANARSFPSSSVERGRGRAPLSQLSGIRPFVERRKIALLPPHTPLFPPSSVLDLPVHSGRRSSASFKIIPSFPGTRRGAPSRDRRNQLRFCKSPFDRLKTLLCKGLACLTDGLLF